MPQFPGWNQDLVGRTREQLARLPAAVADRLRRGLNPLELATRPDVEAQGRLGRDRVSIVLREFLETQREHDEAWREAIRAELREELETLAAAVRDGALAPAPPAAATDIAFDDEPDALDELDADDEDIDLLADEWLDRHATDL